MTINGVTQSAVKGINTVSSATVTSVSGIKEDKVAQGMCAGAVVVGAVLTVTVGAKVGVAALFTGFLGGMVKGYKTAMLREGLVKPEVTKAE